MAWLSLSIQKDVIYFIHRLSHSLIRLNFKELLLFCCSLGTKKYLMPYMVPTPVPFAYLPTSLPPLLTYWNSFSHFNQGHSSDQPLYYIILWANPNLSPFITSPIIPCHTTSAVKFSQFCPKNDNCNLSYPAIINFCI